MLCSKGLLYGESSKPWFVFYRHWAVALSSGVYITQRQVPKMALISTSLDGAVMLLDAPGMTTLKIPLHADGPQTSISKVKYVPTVFLDFCLMAITFRRHRKTLLGDQCPDFY